MGILPLYALPSIAGSVPGTASKLGGLIPYALRCESLTDPVGIGRSRPELSWKLGAAKAGSRGLRQTAYDIRVGTAPGRADLWGSGRVASAAQYGVEFGGKPLRSDEAAFWSVRTWDEKGVPSDWSVPARFSIGLLSDKDWKGKWIAWDAPDGPNSESKRFQGASWIWNADEDPLHAAQESRTFERRLTLGGKPRLARMTLTADDRFTLYVNGREVRKTEAVPDGWRNSISVDLGPYLQAGENTIRVDVENTAEGPAGLLARLTVDGGPTLVTDGAWISGGKPSKIVAPYGGGPWGRFAEGKVLRPSVVYGKSLEIKKRLLRATAHVTALGLVDLSVNGKRISDDRFTPGWTDYKKRVYSKSYDITKLLHIVPEGLKTTGFDRSVEGFTNSIQVEVGDGWYSGYVGYSRQRAHYGERPRVRAQIDLEFTDGTKETVGTDRSWYATTGQTYSQDFLAGEEYSAVPRIDGKGETPYLATDVTAKVEPFPGEPVRRYARLKPIKITPQAGGYILDFGQDLAGFAHLKAKGKLGQRVELQFVEALNADGTPYTANLRSARATDAYTFGGTGVEEWEPRFTFHGFRYLKVTGLGHAPSPTEITAVAISSATPETGRFQCSDPMLNKLAKNAWWTQKMNFIDIPTDCPQRDERLGWTGDAQAYVRTASTYSDVQAFFRKWLVSLDDDQSADGNFSQFAPTIMGGTHGGPAWADAGVICPFTIYDVYGDKRLLAEHYPAMRRFVEFTRNRSKATLLPPDRYHCFGDWLNVNADTPNDIIYEAYFAYSTELLAKAAHVLGKTDDAARYDKLHHDVVLAFRNAYVSEDGTVRGDTQTAYVLALGFDLVDPATAKKSAAKLVAKIKDRNWHLSTGFVGTRDLMRVLSKIGRNDVAFRLLHNKDYPSWGFEIANGATTVWERWDGYTPQKGFQDPGMNSFAHYAYGAVMGWVYQTLGGIDNAAPGFERIVLAPKMDPRLSWAKTSFESIRGTVRTQWWRAGSKSALSVEVPPNAVAEIHLPDGSVKNVGSGSYRFEVGAPR